MIPIATFVLFLLVSHSLAADSSFRIPPVRTQLTIEGQPVTVEVSGSVSAAAASPGLETISVQLDAGLSDLERNLTSILRAQLNQSNRCGERLSVERATLQPAAPSAMLTTDVHFEKWGCAKAFGKEIVKRLVGGNGTVKMRLTPELQNGDTLRVAAEVVSIDADGSLGEALRSGAFGDSLKERIRQTIVSAIDKLDLNAALPPPVREIAALRSAQFSGEPGNPVLSVTGEVRIPADQARAIVGRLKSDAR
jgi:hypothetical protein